MTPLEKRTDLIVVAVGVILAAIGLSLLLSRRTWFGQHLPLPLHPASPRPGTVPRMARGVRSAMR